MSENKNQSIKQSSQSSEQFSKFEIQTQQLEKKVKNLERKLLFIVPLFTVIGSILTTWLTLNNTKEIDRIDFTQEQINNILQEEDIVNISRKLKFLIESNLIGSDETNAQLLKSLNKNLVIENTSLQHFLNGNIYFSKAYDASEIQDDSSTLKFYNLALNEYLKAIELETNNAEFYAMLGITYFNLGKNTNSNSFIEKAMKSYYKAHEINSNLTWVYHEKALVYQHYGKYDEMCLELEKALELDFFYLDKKEDAIELKEKFCN